MVVIDIPVDAIHIQVDEQGEPINPRGPVRSSLDLQASIREGDLIQPLQVRWMDGAKETAYWLQHGHRRLAAVRELGWKKVPCIISEKESSPTEDILLMLAGDVSESYPPLYLARAFARLVAQGVAMKQIADTWGQTADAVSAHIQLLDAHPDAQQAVVDGRMSISAFARVKHLAQEKQADLVASVAEDQPISTRAVMAYMKEQREAKSPSASPFGDNAPFQSRPHSVKGELNVALQAIGRVQMAIEKGDLAAVVDEWPVDMKLLYGQLVTAVQQIGGCSDESSQ